MYSDLSPMYWEFIEDGQGTYPLLCYFSQTPEIPLSQWGFEQISQQIDLMMELYGFSDGHSIG